MRAHNNTLPASSNVWPLVMKALVSPQMRQRDFWLICCFGIACVFTLLVSTLADANPISRIGVDVDRPTVPLSFNFDGTKLVMFGVVEQGSDVAMVIRGPTRTVDVRHKESTFGLWRNDRTVRFRNVPGFYFIATSRAMKGYAPKALISTYSLTIDALGERFAQDFMHTVESEDQSVGEFAHALIAEKQALGLYREINGVLRPKASGLFKIDVDLPAYTPVGKYYAHVLALKDGELVALETTVLEVKRSELQAFISNSAQDHALYYALFCVMTALGLGFGVSWLRK